MSSKTDRRNQRTLEFVKQEMQKAEKAGKHFCCLNMIRFPMEVQNELKKEYPNLNVRCNILNYGIVW